MDKNKKTLLLLVGLVAVAGFIFMPKPKKGKPKPAAAAPSAFFEKKKLLELLDSDVDSEPTLANIEWGSRNPFNMVAPKLPVKTSAPGAAKEVPEKKPLIFKGVVWGGKTPSAVINDRIVGLGETIEGFTVKKIAESMVILTEGDKETVLEMWRQ